MKTKHKIIIDKLFGTPSAYFINALARFLGFFLRIDHSLNKPIHTIVIAKYVGLGSIIQATPLLQTLRKKYPAATLVFVTTHGGKMLLGHIPEVNKTLTISDKNIIQVVFSSMQLLFKLWKLKPQLFIDLEYYSNYSAIITTLSLAKNRLGFYNQDKAYRKGIYNFLIPFNIDLPISTTYLHFAKLLNCEQEIVSLKIEINRSNHWKQISEKINLNKTQSYIVVNPNASDLRLERRWPKQSFIHVLIALIEENKSCTIVLIGDKSEISYVTEIEKQLNQPENIINSAGKLSLSELIILIADAKLMLTNDTGPMHIAFATKTKTISLFGPCSPKQYGGLEHATTFYKKVHCSPCVHKFIIPPCHGDNQCMKLIGEEEVKTALMKLL